jgi:asparagine synthetase B (glutamine-hydrolysing)
MAGFVGACSRTLSVTEASVARAAQMTVYSSKATEAPVFADRALIVHRSFFGFLETTRNHEQAGGLHVWVDGEIYNQAELATAPGEVFADTLLQHYRDGRLEQLLSRVDGVYIALLYDTDRRQLHVLVDRYGLRPFYLYHGQGHLLFGAEVKCFLELETFTPRIRRDVVDSFMHLEHFLGDTTWFEGVWVAAPSTWYTYSLDDDSLRQKRYWTWAAMKPRTLTLDEAAEEMGMLLDQANKSRAMHDGYTVGVALSGGMDSRAILAAVHEQKPPTYTFGIDGSADVAVAKQVVAVAGVTHVTYDTHVDHWLEQRFSGIWKTDGMFNVYHMHYSHLMDKIATVMDVNLSGFLGDAVIGGTYLSKKGKTFLSQRIHPEVARHYYGPYYTQCDLNDTFFDLDKVDPYLFYNRGRRMIGMGAEEAAKIIPQRVPFMDNKLMELSYALPDAYRVNSRVYYRALLRKYPAFYKTIPNASSGVPLTEHPTLAYALRKKYNKLVYAVKYKLGIPTSYTDVYNWIKVPETAAAIRQLLDPKTALYTQYTSENYVTKFLEPHVQGKHNYMKQVMGAVTVEIWLQQVFNKKYRRYEAKH